MLSGCKDFYFCLFLGSIDDHFTIYSRTYLIFLTLHDIMQFYTIYRNNEGKKKKIKEVYTTNDKFCNQLRNRLNLNILLRDHEYPAYFLIDHTFSRMCSYLQTMFVQNWLQSYQLNFLSLDISLSRSSSEYCLIDISKSLLVIEYDIRSL